MARVNVIIETSTGKKSGTISQEAFQKIRDAPFNQDEFIVLDVAGVEQPINVRHIVSVMEVPKRGK